MKNLLILAILLIVFQSCTKTKQDYLKENRFDLNSASFNFPQDNFKILGFGGYHGSAKTEEVELLLLEDLLNAKTIKYYLPETDFSIAHYFNKFLKTGDTLLLKDLVINSGIRVKQERTIQMYNKWKALKKINDSFDEKDRLIVVGVDYQINYKYASRHILELVNNTDQSLPYIQDIQNMVDIDTTTYARGDLSFAYHKLKALTDDYESNKALYTNKISDVKVFEHIITNFKTTVGNSTPEREQVMYDNYLALSKFYDFKNNPQFLRMGFSHICKSREGAEGYPYFFTRLVENEIYKTEDVISVMAYFTDSEVVWDELYNENGDYKGFTTEAGFGIGDYEKEYFRGIQNLKQTKLSDKTLFSLNATNTLYADHNPDLIDVIMTDEKSNTEAVNGQSTVDFIDYAVLISNSEASTPIYEMK